MLLHSNTPIPGDPLCRTYRRATESVLEHLDKLIYQDTDTPEEKQNAPIFGIVELAVLLSHRAFVGLALVHEPLKSNDYARLNGKPLAKKPEIQQDMRANMTTGAISARR